MGLADMRISYLAAAVLLVVLAGGCQESEEPGESSPTWSPDNIRIAFTFDGDIYVRAAGGSERTNLTNSPNDDVEPKWSPGGDKIAYLSQGESTADIYVINPDGTGKTNLTNLPARYIDIEWSPDGTKIAFASNRSQRLQVRSPAPQPGSPETALRPPREPSPELYVMNADGSEITRLTFSAAFEGNPTWSPEGARLAFQSNRDGDQEIYVINVDGTGLSQLTDNERVDATPVWSPDGRRIAFVSNRPSTDFASFLSFDYSVYSMNADGTDQRLLTNVPGINFSRPAWSPDGKYIALIGRDTSPTARLGIGVQGTAEIYLIDLEDPSLLVHAVTNNRTSNPDLYQGPVAWSRDAKSIAFVSGLSGKSRVVHFELKGPEDAG
jgi:Tol biopolymer transport system component